MSDTAGPSRIVPRIDVRRRLPMRIVGFFCLWMIMAGTQAADLVAGLLAAIVAALVSLQLLPPGTHRINPPALARLAIRFLRQSITAGIDVAWRALHPRLPLNPGFVIFEPRSTEGPLRDAFCTMTSLLPGTLPTDTDADGNLVVHCLDITQPVAAQLAVEEDHFRRAFGRGTRDG